MAKLLQNLQKNNNQIVKDLNTKVYNGTIKPAEIEELEKKLAIEDPNITKAQFINLNFVLYNYYKRTNNVKKFYDLCLKLITLLENSEDLNRLGKLYLDHGVNNRILGYYDVSLENLNKAHEIFTKINNKQRLGATLNSIANYYLEKNEYYSAFENYYKAFELVRMNNKAEVYHIVKHNLAHIYVILGYFSRAKDLYNQDLEFLKENQNYERYASSLQGLAEVYIEENRYKLAYKYAKMAVTEYKKTPNSRGLASALATLGYTYSLFNQYDKAIEHYQESQKILQKLNYKIELLRLHYHLGNTYLNIEKFDLSLENLLKSEKLALEIKQNFELRKIYDKLFTVYEKLGQNDNAFDTLKKLKGLNDTFFNFNLQAKVNEVQINFELERIELEYKKEREINEYKNNLFSYITHEFRTPLTLINTPLELIKSENNIHVVHEKIPVIASHINHMQDLLDQLLDINKIDEGKMPIIKRVGSINSLIWHIVHYFEPEMIEKGIEFNFQLPKKTIHGNFDSDKINKIVSNLLTNAIKYISNDGIINLDVTVDENVLKITVEDNGIGIDKQYHENIFTKFYQIPNEKDSKGSGLGLSFVKELIELLNGTIKLTSQQGKGAKFEVVLPFERIENLKNTIKSEHDEVEEDATKTQTLLIVEDNIEIQKLLRDVFNDKYKISLAEHGREAMKKIRKKAPDLVISDIMMPLMDGYELCRTIKNDENLNHIPVILLTAKSQNVDKIEGLGSGADAFITKPFNIDILKQTVESILEQRRKIFSKFSQNIFNKDSDEMVSADVVFINQASDFVLENIENESLSVIDLANHLNMSRFTLIRRFKLIQSITPNNFIQKIRLEKAKEFLRNRVANISEIAFMVGFRSTTYFSCSFKKEFGISPKEFYNNPD